MALEAQALHSAGHLGAQALPVALAPTSPALRALDRVGEALAAFLLIGGGIALIGYASLL